MHRTKKHYLPFLFLSLVLFLGGSGDPGQEEIRLFVPIEGAYWGMALGEAEHLLQEKAYNYETLSDPVEGTRLKLTGDCRNPFGLAQVKEIYLLFYADLHTLMGSSVVFADGYDGKEATETLTKHFGAHQKELDGGTAIYHRSSSLTLNDFPSVVDQSDSLFHRFGFNKDNGKMDSPFPPCAYYREKMAFPSSASLPGGQLW